MGWDAWGVIWVRMGCIDMLGLMLINGYCNSMLLVFGSRLLAA